MAVVSSFVFILSDVHRRVVTSAWSQTNINGSAERNDGKRREARKTFIHSSGVSFLFGLLPPDSRKREAAAAAAAWREREREHLPLPREIRLEKADASINNNFPRPLMEIPLLLGVQRGDGALIRHPPRLLSPR